MKTFLANPRVRIGLTSIVLALLIILVFLKPNNPGPFRAVPTQTSVLIEFDGLVRTGQQLRMAKDTTWQEVLKMKVFQNCWTEIGDVERLFHHNAGARSAFAKNTLLAAFSLHPADSLHPLFILNTGEAIELQKSLAANTLNLKFFPYQFHGQTLFTVHISKNDRVVVAQKGPLLIFSRYSYLVEDALTQLEKARGWWADNRYLGDLDPDAALRMYIRPSKWQAQHEGDLVAEARRIPKTIVDNLVWLGISWNGKNASVIGESSGFLAGLGTWNGTTHGKIFTVLPDNTAFFAWAGFDNRNLFFKRLSETQNGDFEHFVLPWIDQEAGLVVTEPLSTALTDDRLLVLAVRDSTRAREALESYGQTRGLLVHDQIGMFDVFGFQNNSLLAPFFDRSATGFQNPYFVHLGDYVVVAPSRPALEVFIEKYINSQTVTQNTDFLQLAQRMVPEGRGLILLNGGYLAGILHQLLKPDLAEERWTADVERFSKAGWMAAHLTPGYGHKLKVTFQHQPQAVPLPESNIFWKLNLDAPVVTSIFPIEQPEMAGGVALLVQDRKTELYCLKPDGSIQWQKNIGNIIISQIKDIDYFQNGRKCYLFNTKTHVWILDENGKEVQGYPLSLKAVTRTGLTVVDFDKNLKFNYFLGCENGNVYGFDLYGRALEGWNPQSNIGKLAGPILHFQHLGKDYLAVLSDQGQLLVFGRNGALRFPAVTLPGKFTIQPFVDKTGGKPRIICISTAGKLFEVDLAGNARERSLAVKNDNAPLKATQLNWKSGTAYALLQGRQLNVIKADGKKVFSVRLNAVQDDVFASESGVGLCARAKGKVSLLDNTGKMFMGFPLAGSTPFGICNMGQQKLLVSGNGSAILGYKLGE